MKYNYYIILTPGRTGSTLLTKIINSSLENNSFCGEFQVHPIESLSKILHSLEGHADFIKKSFNHKRVIENINSPYYKKKENRDKKWLKDNLKEIEEMKQKVLFNYFKPKDKVSGYKQLFNRDIDLIKNIINSTDNIYFIINTRDSSGLANSYRRAAFSKTATSEEMDVVINEYKELKKIDENRFFEIDYSEFTDVKNEKLKQLFEFMDLEFNESKIQNCLNVKLNH